MATEYTPMPDVSEQSPIRSQSNAPSNAFTLIQASNTTVRKRKQTSVANYLPKKISVDAKKNRSNTFKTIC